MNNRDCLVLALCKSLALGPVRLLPVRWLTVCLLLVVDFGQGCLEAQEAVNSASIVSGITAQIDQRIALGNSKASIVPAELFTNESVIRTL